MKITRSELKKIIKEAVEEELKQEGIMGDFIRSISGKDKEYFQVLSDLMSNPSQALAHEDYLNKNRKLFGSKSSYQPGGALNKAALFAIEAMNKNKGTKGYGQGATLDDVMKAVVQGFKFIGSSQKQQAPAGQPVPQT